MNLCTLLTLGQLKKSKIRLILTLLTMMIASGLMLSMMVKYDLMLNSFNDYDEIYMGKYDVYLVSKPVRTRGLSENESTKCPSREQIHKIMQLPQVQHACVMSESIVAVAPASKGVDYIPMRDQIGPSQHPVMMGLDEPQSPYALIEGNWHMDQVFAKSDTVCVLGSGAANRLNLKVGDTLLVHTNSSVTPLLIVGIVEQPVSTPIVGANLGKARFAPPVASFFVKYATAERLIGKKLFPQYVNIQLKKNDQSSKDAFLVTINELKKHDGFEIYSCDGNGILEAMQGSRSANKLKSDSYTVMGLVFISTLFIIFTALSMGVSERINQFAMLRTIGVTRFQIAIVVLLESILLAVFSWLLGCILVCFYVGFAVFNLSLLLFSFLLILFGSLFSSVLPIYQACSTSPLDGLKTPKIQNITRRCLSPWLLCSAIVLICFQLLIVHVPWLHHTIRMTLYLWIGYPFMMIGFLMLIPAIIIAVERYILPCVSLILRVDKHYLQHCFSSNMLRTIGSCAVLTVGLCLYTMIQFWGYSMLVPFLPTKATPDAIAVFSPQGKDAPKVTLEQVCAISGVDSLRILPLAVEQLNFSKKQMERFSTTGLGQNNIVVIGLDIKKSFLGNDPLFNLSFVQGERNQALSQIKDSRYCLIPDGFAKIAKLKVGDLLEVDFMNPRLHQNDKLVYTIAGVVEIPGWHWLSKHSGLRKKGGFTAGMVFTNYTQSHLDFGHTSDDCYWFDILKNGNVDEIEANLQRLIESQTFINDQNQNVKDKKSRPYVKITTVSKISNIVQGLGDRSINAMSEMPLLILFITGFTLISTLFASVRARLWTFGLFRTQGMTRWMLMRILLLESLIIVTISMLLSLFYGVIIARCAIDICAYAYYFGGITPPLVIPWYGLLIGFGSIYLIGMIASIIPILFVFNKSPLQLLQSGRVVTD